MLRLHPHPKSTTSNRLRGKPLKPPSVDDVFLLVKLSGGRYDYHQHTMRWSITMPYQRLGIWKSIEISDLDLATDGYQEYVKEFIKECLAANGETNG